MGSIKRVYRYDAVTHPVSRISKQVSKSTNCPQEIDRNSVKTEAALSYGANDYCNLTKAENMPAENLAETPQLSWKPEIVRVYKDRPLVAPDF